MDYCGALAADWTHSHGTHLVLSIHWGGCNDTFLQICSDKETKPSASGMRMRRFSAEFHFWVNCPFK